MKKAIITGATGFIGSWLVDELLRHGIDCTLIVSQSGGGRVLAHQRLDSNVHIVEADSFKARLNQFNNKGYDIFYHLGWSGVSSEKKNDYKVQFSNIDTSLYFIELARSLDVKLFVASGTVAEYALSEDIMDLGKRQLPNDFYGASKCAAFYFDKVRSSQLDIPFIWALIPSSYGERRIDNNIITYTIRTLLKKERPSYGNLEQMWDFLYVGEVVRALYLIGERGNNGKIYGIGSNDYHPLRWYIERIRDIIDPSLPLGIGDIEAYSKQSFSSCVNIHDLNEDTGFYPQITFDEGIKKTINYLERY